MLSRFPRSSLFYFALVVVLGLIFWFTWTSIQNSQNQSDWTYTQLIDHAKDHQVSDLEINGTDGIAAETGGKKHNVVLPDCSSGCSQLLTEMQTDGVNVKFDKNSGSSYLISVLLPNIILVILIAAFMWWVLRQTQSGNNQAISFGRSRARMIAGDKPAITFADVAGVDEAKQELTEIVEFLKYPEKFVALGARIPKGVLLVGPPGTGKTLLSKAVAGEAGVPFFSISGSEFVEMFVGVGASRVRDLFDQAKKNSPCIVFVDEIDAVGRQRGAGLGGGPERKSRRISDKEKEVIAYHETGHALVMKALPHTDPVHKISIISRGMALGWTLSLPEEDKYLVSRDELMDQIAGIMGGRVAEEIVFGDITSGAENDIQKATQIARRMVTQWGMSEKLGTVQMGHREELVFLGRDLGEQRTYSEEVAAIIDEEIRSIVDHGYQTAKGVLSKSRTKMDAVVERLKVVETIDGKELDEILAREEPAQPAAASSSAG